MADMKQLTGFFKLPLELRERIYEHLFFQGGTLHIPEPERSIIAAVRRSNKSVRDELTKWQAAREDLTSIKKKYTKCVFAVSPSSRTAAPASPKSWPHIRDIEIIIDDLTLQKNYQENFANDPEVVHRQVAAMRSKLESFVAWVSERNVPLTSMRVRCTQDEEAAPFFTEHIPMNKLCAGVPNDVLDWAPNMAHLLKPLLRLPSCANSIVEQTKDAQDRLTCVDEGLDLVDDLGYDREIGYKLALQGWLKLSTQDRESYEFEDIVEDLAYDELDAWWWP